jgi:predicted Fe-Mo cluster-binding NifX family protein
MNVAIPHWNGRISPVFDSAARVCLIDRRGDVVASQRELALPPDAVEKVRALAEAKVAVLVCGAISQSMQLLCVQAGIDVLANRCGPIEAVIQALLSDRLDDPDYHMPGCCGRRRRWHGRCDGRTRRRHGNPEQGVRR